MSDTEVNIERLCNHHSVSTFQAVGDPDRYYTKVLIERKNAFVQGSIKTPVVYAALEGEKLVGYIEISVLTIRSDDQIKRYAFLPAAAVAKGRPSNTFLKLVEHVAEWRSFNDPAHNTFRGVVCIPGQDTALYNMLARSGFTAGPYEGSQDYLWRPFVDFQEISD